MRLKPDNLTDSGIAPKKRMSDMTPAERKAAYQDSSLKQLMEASGHKICERCYCCDAFVEAFPCWQCGGFEEVYDLDDWGPDPCSVCAGEGELWHTVCAGSCDDNGSHEKSPWVGPGPIPPGLPTESEG